MSGWLVNIEWRGPLLLVALHCTMCRNFSTLTCQCHACCELTLAGGSTAGVMLRAERLMQGLHCRCTACTAGIAIPIPWHPWAWHFLQRAFHCFESHSPAVLLADWPDISSSSVSCATRFPRAPPKGAAAAPVSLSWQAMTCSLPSGHPRPPSQSRQLHLMGLRGPFWAGPMDHSSDYCGEESEIAASSHWDKSSVSWPSLCSGSAVKATAAGQLRHLCCLVSGLCTRLDHPGPGNRRDEHKPALPAAP